MAQRSSENTRGCYCGLWDTNPEVLHRQGLAEGYCGVCDRCGKPGHTRHAPAPSPVTGAWCDACYQWVRYTGWTREPRVWAVIVGIIWAVLAKVGIL